MPKLTDFLILSSELEQQLTARYGVMLGSKDLWHELGFRSPSAFRQALAKGTLNVPVFEVQNRRGRLALAKDVGVWVTRQRMSAPNLDCSPNRPALILNPPTQLLRTSHERYLIAELTLVLEMQKA